MSLLEEFSDICSAEFSKSPPLHGVKHKMTTTGLPIKSNPRRLDPVPKRVGAISNFKTPTTRGR